jgi:2-polyprenyl-6-methoxyphenol hydroxylase-like FAD-dependent oxidoreductase
MEKITHEELIDLAIVGYGPVGQMLALMLGQKGYQVAVYERQPTLYPLPRAVHFDHEVARIFQATGLIPEISEVIEPATSYEWRNSKGETLLLFNWSNLSSSGWYESNMFSQPQLEKVLDNAVKTLPNVQVFQGWEVTGLEQTDDYAELRVRPKQTGNVKSPEAPASEQSRIVKARYVVGADGGNSFVRQALNIKMVDLGFYYDWLVVDVIPHEQRVWEPPSWQLCDPVRPTTIVPGGPGRRRWEFMLLPGESKEEISQPETVWRLLEPWNINQTNATLERHTVYTFRAQWAENWRKGRFLLAGDAAHLMPPFAGQGMCSGLRDVMNLSWKLDLVLAGKARDALLDAYTSERLPNIQHFINFSVELGKVICVADPQAAEARDQAMLAARTDPAMVTPTAPPPPLGPGILHKDDAQAGKLFIQGKVSYQGHTGLFDDVVGPGWSILSTQANPSQLLSSEQIAFLHLLGTNLLQISSSEQPGEEAVCDLEGVYQTYLNKAGLQAVIVRPDFYIFGGVASLEELPLAVEELRQLVEVRQTVTAGI